MNRRTIPVVVIGAILLVVLRVSCNYVGVHVLGEYRLGDNVLHVCAYDVPDRIVDVRVSRFPVVNKLIHMWILPGLQKKVVEFPKADSVAIKIVNDSTIILYSYFWSRFLHDDTGVSFDNCPYNTDTMVVNWNTPMAIRIY